MFNSPSPMATPYGYNTQKQLPNPQEMEMIMRQKWNNNQVISDPYSEYIQELNSASPTVRNKIMQSDEYKEIDYYCENLIKQALYETIVPQLVNTQQGKIAFEKLSQTTKKLRDFYTREEIKSNEQLQSLLQDEVVINRLKELQKQDVVLTNTKVVDVQSSNKNNEKNINNNGGGK